jgi:hypothetical protein
MRMTRHFFSTPLRVQHAAGCITLDCSSTYSKGAFCSRTAAARSFPTEPGLEKSEQERALSPSALRCARCRKSNPQRGLNRGPDQIRRPDQMMQDHLYQAVILYHLIRPSDLIRRPDRMMVRPQDHARLRVQARRTRR